MIKKLKRFLQKSNLVLWGCGKIGREMLESAALMDVQILECVDNSLEKQGKSILVGNESRIIKNPIILSDLSKEYHVIVASQKSNEICQDLKRAGYDEESYICVSKKEVRALLIGYIASVCDSFASDMNCSVNFVFLPYAGKIRQPSVTESALRGWKHIIGDRMEWLRGNPPHVALAHRELEHYSKEYIENIFTAKNAIRKVSGELAQEEHISQYVNVINGMRVTTDQPMLFKKKVHIFGPSLTYGFGVEDAYTLASCLQRQLNGLEEDYYKVLNYGVRGLPLEEYCPIITHADIGENDDILCIIVGDADKECKEALLEYRNILIDLSDYFQRPHEFGEVFFDSYHLNYKGYAVSARILCELIFRKSKSEKVKNTVCKSEEERLGRQNAITESSEFRTYMDFLDLCRNEVNLPSESVRGGVVVAANPFTLGHRHLINIASSMVDYLYVFVLEDDGFYVPFEDRYDLVVKGTENIDNVKVVSGGKILISNVTFPEYFDKENASETTIALPLDIDIFGGFVAKKLGISIRFVGEEPNDFITSQYNMYMRERLPLYNIKFIEIPRLRKDGEVISAKRVRKLISLGRLEELQNLVPATTYQYLMRKYGKRETEDDI